MNGARSEEQDTAASTFREAGFFMPLRPVSPPHQVLTPDHPRRAEYAEALRQVQAATSAKLAATERLSALEKELAIPPREARALAAELLGAGVEIPATAPAPDPRSPGGYRLAH